MIVHATLDHEFFSELRTAPAPGGEALHEETISGDLADLLEEAYVRAVLAGLLHEEYEELYARFTPQFAVPPYVTAIGLELETRRAGESARSSTAFASGRWARRAERRLAALAEAGVVHEGTRAHLALHARRTGGAAEDLGLRAPMPPRIAQATREECGLLSLGAGELDPRRPVLVHERMRAAILSETIAAGANETGGSVLGKIVRLPLPLAGTDTPIVTLLTAALPDRRHAGAPGQLAYDPQALVDARELARLRGMGESVLSAYHSHGWGCGKCNSDSRCPLPEATLVSGDDYQVLEALFPSKAALLPIAGRRMGAAGTAPVLVIHAWVGGRTEQVTWRTYDDRVAAGHDRAEAGNDPVRPSEEALLR